MSKKRNLGKRDRAELRLLPGFARSITRPELLTILSLAPPDQRLKSFHDMMLDPAHSNKNLATMGRECNVTFAELAKLVKEYKTAEGMVRMSQHLPQVMEDVARDALNTEEYCQKCQGAGSIVDTSAPPQKLRPDSDDPRDVPLPVPKECPQCKGAGSVKKSGDAGARKLLFESMGLVGGKGPLVAIQNNTLNAGDGGDDLESVLKLARRPQAQLPAIDAEVVKDGD